MNFIYIKNGVQHCIDEHYICESCINNHHQNSKHLQTLFALIFIGIFTLILIQSPVWFINIVFVISLPYMYFFIKKYNRNNIMQSYDEDMVNHCAECGQTNL
jgi:1,4-dihydroxy-2-naphthoate octaprenyltransferase